MLTKQESILEYDFSDQSVTPDRLTQKTHAEYLGLADELIGIYRDRVGDTRREVHASVERRMQQLEDCSSRRIAAFCKLLDDASEYASDRGNRAAKLRARVFTIAAAHHPLVHHADHLFATSESETKQRIADEIGRPWTEIESELFADVIEFHCLKKPPDPSLDGIALLRRYNVAQTQTALYGAIEMTVLAKRDFKTVLRYAKLARLMHTIARQDDGYLFRFNGPASVIRGTRRYGVAMARFLPGLLAAEDWRMRAIVIGPLRRRFALRLTSGDGLHGEIEPGDFDSDVEETFHRRWIETDTHGWSIQREATILHEGQTVFLPDFTLIHPEHGEVLLEIVGFWTPEYLREKANRLQQFRTHAKIMLAIAETVDESIPDLDLARVTYKTKLLPKTVLDCIESRRSPNRERFEGT